MYFLTYQYRNQVAYGAIVDSGVVNLSTLMPEYPSLRHVLEDDGLNRAQDIAAARAPQYGFADIDFLPTIPNPQKIICIGVNYGNRNEEYRDSSSTPKYPSVFMRTRESLVGHLQPILRPPESEQLDYEGEIVMVIGKSGRRIPEDQARAHVAGLTLMNEGSVRDWLRHSKFNVTQGKNFEKSGSLGPWLATADEFNAFDSLHLTTTVNGELRQDDRTDNLMFSFERLISYLSTFMRLQPGDLISTGTPTGAGARFDPPKFLKSGDVVEVRVTGIGMLSNPVQDEAI